MSRAPTKEEVDLLLRTVQTPSIQKAVLQSLCVVNGLPKTGNKAELQKRLMKLINESRSDSQKLGEIRESIRTLTGIPLAQPIVQPPQPPQPPTSYYPPASPRGPSSQPPYHAMPPYNPPGSFLPAPNGHRQNSSSTPYAQLSTLSPTRVKDLLARPITYEIVARRVLTTSAGFPYKPSPFHKIICQLGELKTLMPQNRNLVTIPLKANDNPSLLQCSTDSRYRVMVFCAAGNSGTQEVSFPHQSELKVNGGDVKANLRGLKNKPGSTRPVDITSFLRLKPPSYVNMVEFTYALTQKKFYFGVYVCETTPVEALVDRIQRKISKHTVMSEISKKASDPDVVATSQNISLKCPLSYMRLQTPCRAFGCTHVQCFDATSYLQLQEQGPQWVCPICNKPAPYDQLAIDEYVTEIIKGTPESVEQVTIEPDGHWVLPGTAQKKAAKSVSQDASYVDEDDFFISDMFQTPNQHRSTPTHGQGGSVTSAATAYLDTPSNSASRDSSAIPKSATSNKRTMSDVIDLTLSDDDEQPRAKRTYHGSNGYGFS